MPHGGVSDAEILSCPMSVNPVGWGFELDPGRGVARVVSWIPGKRVVITPSFALEPAHSDAYDGVGSRPRTVWTCNAATRRRPQLTGCSGER